MDDRDNMVMLSLVALGRVPINQPAASGRCLSIYAGLKSRFFMEFGPSNKLFFENNMGITEK